MNRDQILRRNDEITAETDAVILPVFKIIILKHPLGVYLISNFPI